MTKFEIDYLKQYGISLEDALKRQAQKGITLYKTAQWLGICMESAMKYSKRYGIVFQKSHIKNQWSKSMENFLK